jgi:hypothetical protein
VAFSEPFCIILLIDHAMVDKKDGYILMCLQNCTSPIHLPTMEGLQETRNASGLLRIIME